MKNPNKKRLDTLTKNSPTHFFRNLSRILKYGVIGYGRNIWLSLTSTIVMTLTLILLFITIVASLMLSATAQSMREKIDMLVFLKPGTSETSLAVMTKTLESDSNVKTATYSTSEDECLKNFRDIEGDDNLDLIEVLKDESMRETMLKSMPAVIRFKVYDAEDLTSVKSLIAKDADFVKNIDPDNEPSYETDSSAIDAIVNWSNIARIGGLALSALFLLISVLVIFNTIRMAIYSRSEEIYMERLVGADKSFIRGPFLVEATISGIIAGILSSIASIVALNALSPKLENYDIDVSSISNYVNSSSMVLVILAFIGVGMIIALISSRLAVHKYLKKM